MFSKLDKSCGFFVVVFVVVVVVVVVGESSRQKRATISVTQTRSGVKCRGGSKCHNNDYSQYYCYVDGDRWETCCNDNPGCVTLEHKSNESYCNVVASTSLSEDSKRCRRQALATTLSGRPCAEGEYCGFYRENYQWCWLDKSHENWDHCCFPDFQCGKNWEYKDQGYYFNSCDACKDEQRNCGKNCQYTVCEQREHPCNPDVVDRSLNNYQCHGPCNEDSVSYGWCWVKPNEEAWDWCCAIGEICGVVKNEDKGVSKMCYVKKEQAWPMTCVVEVNVTALPPGYESPPTPLEPWHIVVIVLSCVAVVVLIIICYCVYRRSRQQKNLRELRRRQAESSVVPVTGHSNPTFVNNAPPDYHSAVGHSTAAPSMQPLSQPPAPPYPGANNAPWINRSETSFGPSY